MTDQQIIFPHDLNIKITVPSSHPFSTIYIKRPYREILFRKIHTFLIKTKIIDPTANMIDLGAWIGDNTLPWSKMITGTVYAIDPSVDNCAYIKELVQLNQAKNVEIIQTAISETNKILSTNGDLHHCSFEYGNPGKNGKHQIKSTSLDSLYLEKKITNIGYIHLDVEGMEHLVIRGAKKIIDRDRPVMTYEVHLELDSHIDQTKKRFILANYQVFMINEILPGCRLDCRNMLAIPEERIGETFLPDLVDGLYDDLCQGRKYCLVYQGDHNVNLRPYDDLEEGTKHFDRMNGGHHAVILVEFITSKQESDDKSIKILKRYGEPQWVQSCIDHLNRKKKADKIPLIKMS
uniref:Methyltransferase n=1 Tax=Pithovirus LCPAC201 TaxID=2506591 RepID=A0A481Z530_9VIRU|nr:MAG: methyltransferase [Pithovirus LCPAC201]